MPLWKMGALLRTCQIIETSRPLRSTFVPLPLVVSVLPIFHLLPRRSNWEEAETWGKQMNKVEEEGRSRAGKRMGGRREEEKRGKRYKEGRLQEKVLRNMVERLCCSVWIPLSLSKQSLCACCERFLAVSLPATGDFISLWGL